MFRTNCIMHFLRSSPVCVLPRYFFRCAHIKLLYIDINGIASYRIAYKKYIDISYKLDIPTSPTPQYQYVSSSCTESFIFYLSIGSSVTSTGVASGGMLPPGLTEEEAEEIQVELTKVPQTFSSTLNPSQPSHLRRPYAGF